MKEIVFDGGGMKFQIPSRKNLLRVSQHVTTHASEHLLDRIVVRTPVFLFGWVNPPSVPPHASMMHATTSAPQSIFF